MEKPSKREIEQGWLDSHDALINLNDERLKDAEQIKPIGEPKISQIVEAEEKRNWGLIAFVFALFLVAILYLYMGVKS